MDREFNIEFIFRDMWYVGYVLRGYGEISCLDKDHVVRGLEEILLILFI